MNKPIEHLSLDRLARRLLAVVVVRDRTRWLNTARRCDCRIAQICAAYRARLDAGRLPLQRL
jgi:hypothetical protein